MFFVQLFYMRNSKMNPVNEAEEQCIVIAYHTPETTIQSPRPKTKVLLLYSVLNGLRSPFVMSYIKDSKKINSNFRETFVDGNEQSSSNISYLWKLINKHGWNKNPKYFCRVHVGDDFVFRVTLTLNAESMQAIQDSNHIQTYDYDTYFDPNVYSHAKNNMFLSKEYDIGFGDPDFNGWCLSGDQVDADDCIIQNLTGGDITESFRYPEKKVGDSCPDSDGEDSSDGTGTSISGSINSEQGKELGTVPKGYASEHAPRFGAPQNIVRRFAAAPTPNAAQSPAVPAAPAPLASPAVPAPPAPLASARVEEALGRPAKAADENLMDAGQVAGLGAAAFAIAALSFLSAL